MTYLGRNATHMFVSLLEFLRIAPKGSVAISSILNATALDLVEGGIKDIFTPGYLFLAKKKWISRIILNIILWIFIYLNKYITK